MLLIYHLPLCGNIIIGIFVSPPWSNHKCASCVVTRGNTFKFRFTDERRCQHCRILKGNGAPPPPVPFSRFLGEISPLCKLQIQTIFKVKSLYMLHIRPFYAHFFTSARKRMASAHQDALQRRLCLPSSNMQHNK